MFEFMKKFTQKRIYVYHRNKEAGDPVEIRRPAGEGCADRL